MLRFTAIRALSLTAALAFCTLGATAQEVKPGKGVPGGGNPGVAARGGGPAPRAIQPGRGGMGGGAGFAPRAAGPGRMTQGQPGGWSPRAGGQGGVQVRPGGGQRYDGRRAGGGWRGPAIGAGVGLGLGLGYPYGYGYQPAPVYPAYPAYQEDAYGDHCETPRRICQLYDSAPIGADCSCRVPGGRAYGEVIP
jgi:hypothetical protein